MVLNPENRYVYDPSIGKFATEAIDQATGTISTWLKDSRMLSEQRIDRLPHSSTYRSVRQLLPITTADTRTGSITYTHALEASEGIEQRISLRCAASEDLTEITPEHLTVSYQPFEKARMDPILITYKSSGAFDNVAVTFEAQPSDNEDQKGEDNEQLRYRKAVVTASDVHQLNLNVKDIEDNTLATHALPPGELVDY